MFMSLSMGNRNQRPCKHIFYMNWEILKNTEVIQGYNGMKCYLPIMLQKTLLLPSCFKGGALSKKETMPSKPIPA